MKKELSKIQKIQNLLFILLNFAFVILGFCFITTKIQNYKLICIILFSVYCLLGYCYIMNLLELQQINIDKFIKLYKKEN